MIYSLDHPNPLTHSLLFCKLRGYLFQICLMLSRWFVAFACIDRYAQSSENVRLRNFASVRTSYRSIIGIIIFWSIICTHRAIFYQIKGNICGIVTNFGASIYHTLYVLIGGGILPATIMTGCAFLIRRNLARKRQRRHTQVTTVIRTEHERQQHSLDQQVLSLLFIQSFFYTLLTTPQLINLVYSTVSSTNPNISADQLAIESIAAFLAELMLYVFPVASFYVYTLTARTFRQELIKVFRSLFNFVARRSHVQIVPTNNSLTIQYKTGNQTVLARLSNRRIARSSLNTGTEILPVPPKLDDGQRLPAVNEVHSTVCKDINM